MNHIEKSYSLFSVSCLCFQPYILLVHQERFQPPLTHRQVPWLGLGVLLVLLLGSQQLVLPGTPEAPQRPDPAFCTWRGLWKFKVLSFGLCNAPATFCEVDGQGAGCI